MALLFAIIAIIGVIVIGSAFLAANSRRRWDKKQRERFERWNEQMNRKQAK